MSVVTAYIVNSRLIVTHYLICTLHTLLATSLQYGGHLQSHSAAQRTLSAGAPARIGECFVLTYVYSPVEYDHDGDEYLLNHTLYYL